MWELIKEYQGIIGAVLGGSVIHLIQHKKYSAEIKRTNAEQIKLEQDTVDSTVDLWRKMVAQLREDVTSLTGEMKSLKYQNKLLINEVGKLRQQNHTLTSEVEKLRKEVEKLHNENITLKNKKQ